MGGSSIKLRRAWSTALLLLVTIGGCSGKSGCGHRALRAFGIGDADIPCPEDRDNCGGCGIKCPEGAECVKGACACASATPHRCSSWCANLQSDVKNCGECGRECVRFARCVSGSCGCPPELPDSCTYACVKLATDAANCGKCGNRCAPGEKCEQGTCAFPEAKLALATGHTCMVSLAGVLTCWGATDRLHGLPTPSAPAVVIASGVSEVGVGVDHRCALMASGEVRCWGDNTLGQLGTEVATRCSDPLRVGTPVIGMHGPSDHPCAGTPVVSGVARASSIVSGADHMCALKDDGAVVCWGSADTGRLGTIILESPRRSPTPLVVSGAAGATAIATGGAHTCALRADRTVVCWGANESGQLGNAKRSGFEHVPASVAGLTGVVELVAGSAHTCARSADGAIACWGANDAGQLGDGTHDARTTPKVVAGLTDVVELAAGAKHTCARSKQGTIKCWGSNAHGQVGAGRASATPLAVPGIANATRVGAGPTADHTCAATKGGPLLCWGANAAMQLGDRTSVDRHAPVAVVF